MRGSDDAPPPGLRRAAYRQAADQVWKSINLPLPFLKRLE